MSTLAVLTNTAFGEIGISEEAQKKYEEKSGEPFRDSLSRHDPHLIATVRELGPRAVPSGCRLVIDYIPSEMKDHYKIVEYDGCESIILLYSQKVITEAREIATSSDSSLTSGQKLSQISEVLSGPCIDTKFRTRFDPSSENESRKENFYSEYFSSDEDG